MEIEEKQSLRGTIQSMQTQFDEKIAQMEERESNLTQEVESLKKTLETLTARLPPVEKTLEGPLTQRDKQNNTYLKIKQLETEHLILGSEENSLPNLIFTSDGRFEEDSAFESHENDLPKLKETTTIKSMKKI